MATLATVEDLATFLAQPINTAQAELILDLAEAMVLAEYGADTPAEGTAAANLLRHALLGSAGRAYRSPEGITQETVGSYSYTRDGAGLYLNVHEKAAIVRARTSAGSPRPAIYSVPLTTPSDDSAVW